MSDDAAFRCPVCRASQTLRETCRRCQADLRLVMRAHLRLAYLKRRQAEAISRGDIVREQSLAAELCWLAPLDAGELSAAQAAFVRSFFTHWETSDLSHFCQLNIEDQL